jgi:hypothetical protein
MNHGQLLRKRLFDKYSANLHLLHSEGLLPHLHLSYDQTFICPVCLDPFSADDLDTIYLQGMQQYRRTHLL